MKPPKDHAVPPLLDDFGAWLAGKKHGSLGYFELLVQAVGPWGLDAAAAKRLARDAFSFVHLGEGSQLLLIDTGRARQPRAVVLLGSEGETEVVADSLEEFLLLLSTGETGIADLDEEEATGRRALRAWLKKRGVSATRVEQRFDFDAYLEGRKPKAPPATPAAPKSQMVSGLPPFFSRVVSMVGRRADDPELVTFVTEELGKKLPNSTTHEMKHVVAPKHGLELGFEHRVEHDDYPPIAKTKASFIPYLTIAWVRKKLPGGLPFGLEFEMSRQQIRELLGAPNRSGRRFDEVVKWWVKPLDAARGIVLDVEGGNWIKVKIDDAHSLDEYQLPPPPDVSLFVAWAARRGLVDKARFAAHGKLLAAVAAGKERGSALLAAALPRGLWDNHLVDAEGLRELAYAYFHNLGWAKCWIKRDLIKVFGKRVGPHGHDEPKLDEDSEAALMKAMPVFDQRFAEWLKKR